MKIGRWRGVDLKFLEQTGESLGRGLDRCGTGRFRVEKVYIYYYALYVPFVFFLSVVVLLERPLGCLEC